MALKRRKDLIDVCITITDKQYEHLPFRYRDMYIRHLIDKDMAPDTKESFLQFMSRVRY